MGAGVQSGVVERLLFDTIIGNRHIPFLYIFFRFKSPRFHLLAHGQYLRKQKIKNDDK